MIRRTLLVLVIWATTSVAFGYWHSVQQVSVGSAAYAGPGDIKSGAYLWFGLRGYNTAYTGNIADICDQATGATCVTATWAGSTLTIPTVGGSACNNTTNICVIKKAYDQSGNGRDVSQGTLANMPVLALNVVGSRACMQFAGSQFLFNASTITTTAPFTVSMVVNNTGGGGYWANTGAFNLYSTSAGANTIRFSAGTLADVSMTDNAFHAVQEIGNGASSDIYIDGVSNVVNAGSDSNTNVWLVANNSFGGLLTGYICEQGFWNSAFSAGEKSNMNANQHSYWGF